MQGCKAGSLYKQCGSITAAGTDNPGALAEQLVAAEDSKFRWFSYVNELNAEHEVLQGQIHALESELRIARAEAAAQQEWRLLQHDVSLFLYCGWTKISDGLKVALCQDSSEMCCRGHCLS